jgi:hypothetical protein
MPVQTTQAQLAAISASLRSMDETLKEILSRVPPNTWSAPRPEPRPPK